MHYFNGLDALTIISLATVGTREGEASLVHQFVRSIKTKSRSAKSKARSYLGNSAHQSTWLSKTNDLLSMQPLLSPTSSSQRIEHWISSSGDDGSSY